MVTSDHLDESFPHGFVCPTQVRKFGSMPVQWGSNEMVPGMILDIVSTQQMSESPQKPSREPTGAPGGLLGTSPGVFGDWTAVPWQRFLIKKKPDTYLCRLTVCQ